MRNGDSCAVIKQNVEGFEGSTPEGALDVCCFHFFIFRLLSGLRPVGAIGKLD